MTKSVVSQTILRENLVEETENLLSRLGVGAIDSVTYDTTWIARLAQHFPNQGFDGALSWLRQRQYDDGSWGGQILHHHDRFICTLSAIVALRSLGASPSDERRIQKGEDYLWHAYTHLHHDAHDTIAFSVLAVAMINEAAALGLDVPRDLYYDVSTIEKKLNMIGHISKDWRNNTMSFSLEAAHPDYPAQPDFLESNASVGVSPAATAAMLIQSKTTHQPSLTYLQNTLAAQGDGGAPNVGPIDTFETMWSLNSLRIAGAITPDHPQVKRLCKFLWDAWSQERGIGFSSFYSVPDLDDTSIGFTLLQWSGYDVNAAVFAHYEEENHFRCYPNETNPSINAHFGMLGAMRMVPNHPRYEAWTEKILSVIRRYSLYGQVYFDKWHYSPYYLRCAGVCSMNGIADTMAQDYIKWILRTQHTDGGWGFSGYSTPEETAYALQSLLVWDRSKNRVAPESIDAGANYLFPHLRDQEIPSLWIGKCLYTPRNVVRSAIAAALWSYLRSKE